MSSCSSYCPSAWVGDGDAGDWSGGPIRLIVCRSVGETASRCDRRRTRWWRCPEVVSRVLRCTPAWPGMPAAWRDFREATCRRAVGAARPPLADPAD